MFLGDVRQAISAQRKLAKPAQKGKLGLPGRESFRREGRELGAARGSGVSSRKQTCYGVDAGLRKGKQVYPVGSGACFLGGRGQKIA